MNEEKLAELTEQLTTHQEQFVTAARMIVEASQALTEALKANHEYLDAYRLSFEGTEDLMAKQINLLKEIAAGMEALIKANADTNATVSENSQQMKALLAKVDSYFGTTSGLDYDN